MMGGLKARVVAWSKRRDNRRSFLTARGPRGFTIIEVMIVLAVTGGLFISAAVLIAGRQAKTEFSQAIRQVQSQIQQVINDVATGYYPNTSNFQCNVTGTGAPNVTPGTTEQGTNTDCIFMGKVMQFDIAGTDPEEFKVYTLVGRRTSSDNVTEDASSRANAKPVVIAPSTNDPDVPDNSQTGLLQSGLTTHSMVWGAGSGTPTGAVAFSQSLAQYSDGLIQSGAQQLSVIPITNASYAMTLDMTKLEGAESINRNYVGSTADPANGVRICFASGGTNQSGLIRIGGNQGQLAVTLTIMSNKTCSP